MDSQRKCNCRNRHCLPDLSTQLVASSLSWTLGAAVNQQFCEISLFLPPITGPTVSLLPLGSHSHWLLNIKVTVQCDRIPQKSFDKSFCHLVNHVCLWDQHMTFNTQEEGFISYPAGGKCQTVRWLFDQQGSRRCPNCCWCEETTRLTALKGQLSLENRSRESRQSAMNCELVAVLLWFKAQIIKPCWQAGLNLRYGVSLFVSACFSMSVYAYVSGV